MAGTMPHAIFMEPDVDGPGTYAAYAAEFPGCAVFGDSDEVAAAAMPARVAAFGAWLRERGQTAPTVIGDNWYEVDGRPPSTASTACDARPSAWMSCRPPTPSSRSGCAGWSWRAKTLPTRWMRPAPSHPMSRPTPGLWPAHDLAMAGRLATRRRAGCGRPVDALYAARDLLTDALEQAGPARDGVRRVLRLAIADDLRLADRLRGGGG